VKKISLRINGHPRQVVADSGLLLIDLLRDRHG